MNVADVTNLFRDFDHSEVGVFDRGLTTEDIRFQTNVIQGTEITFHNKSIGFFDNFENCTVYFDTNGVIAGFYYSRDDGRRPGAAPKGWKENSVGVSRDGR
jgi:hypothetical protein